MKLYIDRIDFNSLTKEFGKDAESEIIGFLINNSLYMIFSEEAVDRRFDSFEAGFKAAQH
jgi:hypothetical protein